MVVQAGIGIVLICKEIREVHVFLDGIGIGQVHKQPEVSVADPGAQNGFAGFQVGGRLVGIAIETDARPGEECIEFQFTPGFYVQRALVQLLDGSVQGGVIGVLRTIVPLAGGGMKGGAGIAYVLDVCRDKAPLLTDVLHRVEHIGSADQGFPGVWTL